MKTFLIIILSTVLAIGAFLSRPTEDSFRAFVQQKLSNANVPAAMLGGKSVRAITEGCAYHDRLLWSVVEINGKTVYAGVFSRWFAIPETGSAQPSAAQSAGAGVSAF